MPNIIIIIIITVSLNVIINIIMLVYNHHCHMTYSYCCCLGHHTTYNLQANSVDDKKIWIDKFQSVLSGDNWHGTYTHLNYLIVINVFVTLVTYFIAVCLTMQVI